MAKDVKEILSKSHKEVINGWIHLSVQGTPYECGFQNGYNLVNEYKDAMRVYSYMTLQTFGVDYSFFTKQAVRLHKNKLPDNQIEELQGMADGLTEAGYPTTLNEIIGWNDWMEITGYWWPKNIKNYAENPNATTPKSSHCSAIIATGSSTQDGKPVIAHESFDDFWCGQYFNICLEINPINGNKFIMQTLPCSLSSFTDFYITSTGLAVTETTLAGFSCYDDNGVPEFSRIRNAIQFGDSIDGVVNYLQNGNNGGYANAWLIADNNTGEIARFEQGLKYQDLKRTFNGTFFGCNAVFDPRIRNLECVDNGFNDPRQQTGARRQRFMELIDKYDGKITLDIAKKILADTYDVYLGYENPSSRCICSHYDADPQYYADDPNAVWNIPFYPAGSCDAKAADSANIANLEMWGRYGRADGTEFDAEQFLAQHPLWRWQEGYLKSRPSEPWTLFKPFNN